MTTVAAGEAGRSAGLGRLRAFLDIRYLAVITAIATYALIVLGGTVRATDSGLACPDWPRCHGELIPPLEKAVLIEFSHRLAAAAVGLLVLGTAVTAWLWHRESRLVLTGALLALMLLIVQVFVGGVTVNMELPDTVVALHLGIALTLLAVLVVTAVGAFRGWRGEDATRASSDLFLRLGLVAALGTFGLILVGSYVANSGAALVYPDWPLFDGKLVSAGGRLADLHYVHRVMAALVGLPILALAVHTWRKQRHPVLLAAVSSALVLYVAQVFVGASNIWFDLATSVRVAHLALASALWAALALAVSWVYAGVGTAERREGRDAR